MKETLLDSLGNKEERKKVGRPPGGEVAKSWEKSVIGVWRGGNRCWWRRGGKLRVEGGGKESRVGGIRRRGGGGRWKEKGGGVLNGRLEGWEGREMREG